MTTTLTLVETYKTDSRKNGDLSYAKVCILLDGIPVDADFRARVGEEPIVIHGETITVSDVQIESLRNGRAHAQKIMAEHDAREAQRAADAWASVHAGIDKIAPTDEARAELRAVYEAYPDIVTDALPPALVIERFERAIKAARVRHGIA